MTTTRWPAEWGAQAELLAAWPDHPEEWPAIELAREAVVGLCEAIGDSQKLTLFVAASRHDDVARRVGSHPTIVQLDYGDIWMRDTAPLFRLGEDALEATAFRWTGWGGRFVLPGDEKVAGSIATRLGVPLTRSTLAAEGGALETDGRGTVLATRECLLDPHRNPNHSEEQVEAELEARLGVTRTIWLDRGLLRDHTSGHVDNVARFVARGLILCAEPAPGDPNVDVHREVAGVLAGARDATATTLDVLQIPSPGAVEDASGALLPASYLNFTIANDVVVVPLFDRRSDEAALEVLESVFPDHRIVGVSAAGLLCGGGTFHCMTAHVPLVRP